MQIRRSNKAVSEIIGTMLLLVLAISALSLIYFQVLSDDGPDSRTIVKIVGKVEGTDVVLEHQGGEPLEMDTEISITIAGTEYNGDVSEWLNDENNDGKWNLGERMVFSEWEYELDRLGDYTEVNLMAVDHEDNSIAFMGPIELHPVSDIGIEITVDDGTPEIGDIIEITITVTSYGGDVNGSGNVIVKYLLPEGLIHNDNTSSQGTYNNETGFWEIGNVLVGTPAILKINAIVVGIQIREFMQLAMVLDGSGSISSSDWLLMKTGLANSIEDEDIFPHDGTIELTVIQFGVNYNECKVEIPPTIVNSSNFQAIADYIGNLIQGDGGTPMAAGIYLTADIMKDSSNYDYVDRQVITLVTDGEPTYWSNFDEYIGHGDGWYVDEEDIQTTETARNYSIDHLLMTDEKDEFNSLAVGSGPDVTWLNSSIIWPEPGYIWDITSTDSPPGPGWVATIDTFSDFEYAINEMFKLLFSSITNTVEYVDSTTWDPNDGNNDAAVIILPEE